MCQYGQTNALERLQNLMWRHDGPLDVNASLPMIHLLQVVHSRAPTLVDADTYITPSSFDDAIKACSVLVETDVVPLVCLH